MSKEQNLINMKRIKYYLDLIVNDQKLHSINKEELKVVLMDFAKEYHVEQLRIGGVSYWHGIVN